MEPILTIKGLCKRFGGIMALNEVEFSVEKGEILGLIGPNGAGKTTLFNCITGVYKPTKGEILLRPEQGQPKRTNGKKPEIMTLLGVTRTFQNIRLFSELTVLDNVRIGRHPRTKVNFFGAVLRTRAYNEEERQVVDDSMKWLEFVGLDKKALQQAASLPYGDQRRLEIARALATEPRVLLLDEPAAGMNPRETEDLKKLIRAILGEGVTVILIEHDMKLVMSICGRLVVLDHGAMIAQGDPKEIRNNPQVIEAYLGRGAADA